LSADEPDEVTVVKKALAEHLDGQVDGKAVRLDYRMIFVWSESKARQEASTRERHTAKVVAEAGTTADAVKGLADVGLQVPVVVSQFDSSPEASATADSAGLGSLASGVYGAARAVRR